MELKDTVGRVAPILGSLLGGPVGSVVATLISSVFGGDPIDTKDLAVKINSDPDKDIKLLELQNKHAQYLSEVAMKCYQSEVSDRVDARSREIQLVKLGKKEWIMEFLAIAYTLGFFCYIGLSCYKPASDDHMNIMIISSVITLIIGYYFGSSKENKK